MSKKLLSKIIKMFPLVYLILGILIYSFSIWISFTLLSDNNVPLEKEVNPEVINGILTVSAIIAAFSTFEMGKRPLKQWVVLIALFVGQMMMLMIVGLDYFANYIIHEHATVQTMALALSSLCINTLSWIFYRGIRALWGEE